MSAAASNPVVIRVAKLKTVGHVVASGQHTWREISTPNADAGRTSLNVDLREVRSSAGLAEAVQARIAKATEKAEHPVVCLEYLVTADHSAFAENGGHVDADAYLRDALRWIEAKHGAANIVAANIQRDELTPHLVVYVVPLVEVAGKPRKRSVIVGKNPDGTRRRETRDVMGKPQVRLSAAHFYGAPHQLSQLQTDFAAQVGAKHGLRRGVPKSRAKHTTVREFYASVERAEALGPISGRELQAAARLGVTARRRIRALEDQAIAAEARAQLIEGLDDVEVRKAVEHHRAQRRADRLFELLGSATGIVGSICRRLTAAIKAAGHWTQVTEKAWERAHSQVLDDCREEPKVLVVEQLYEYSPALVDGADKEADLQWALEDDESPGFRP